MINIENLAYPTPNQEYKVLVRCFTFNQSKYIEDALNGFAMQQTNFPFVCLVMDDASTDGEQEIIKKWMECECDMSRAEIIDIPTSTVITVPHKTNPSCSFAFYLLKLNLYRNIEEKMRHVTPWREKCRYEALCEGDDYWIDPLKLQKQVDFLEANPEYGMCYTNFEILYQKSGRMLKNAASTFPNRYPMVYKTLKDYIKAKGYVCPPSWVYRKGLINSYETIQGACDGTFCMFSHFMNISKTFYLDDVTSVYRVLENSASHSQDPLVDYKRRKDLLELQLILLSKYGFDEEEKDSCYSDFYRQNVLFFAENHMVEELRNAQLLLNNLTKKEKFLLTVGSSKIGSVVIKTLHLVWLWLKRY